MKQGINQLMLLRIGMDIELADKIEFLFKQGSETKLFTYPSNTAIKCSERSVNLVWTPEDTYRFNASVPIELDTRITLKDSRYQPETNIINVDLKRTLFPEG